MSRETDRDWATLGEIEPYFAVLSEDKYRRDRLDAVAMADFWASGERDVEHYLGSIRAYFGDVPISDALDFGCGVGRLAKAIAARASRVVGVDVSPGMLAEARKHAPANLEFTDVIPNQEYDWVNSTIVFQHIPPERGYGLFDALLDRIRPGGVFSIQTTFYKDETYLPQLLDTVKGGSWDGERLINVLKDESGVGAILMYDYNYTKLLISAVTRGFKAIHLQHTNHGGCHGFMMFGRRS